MNNTSRRADSVTWIRSFKPWLSPQTVRAAVFSLVGLGIPCPVIAADHCMAQNHENDIRACLDREYQNAEANVHAAEQDFRKNVPQLGNDFQIAEDRWRAYKQAECNLEGDAFRGGTLEADLAGQCATSLDNQRAYQIRHDAALAEH
ncbi:lysozyme inhibitor LprI family protein [Acidisoma silvae]|uniref:DUF1311 domain-containing protein n=1 Tax=Acidisoma silvae TaxID=2802396 RepID=A0A963YW73_9PROT|nr:lysozyme inhibitor LprI family protein [Acidisoma silvae]MCB8878286.1 DUF1311 domain-containing protein [Acidisoma silvae]